MAAAGEKQLHRECVRVRVRAVDSRAHQYLQDNWQLRHSNEVDKFGNGCDSATAFAFGVVDDGCSRRTIPVEGKTHSTDYYDC